MFYAQQLKSRFDNPTVLEGRNGRIRPYNFKVVAFDTKARLQSQIDKVWDDGGNLIPCTRKYVESLYGRHFATCTVDGLEICDSADD